MLRKFLVVVSLSLVWAATARAQEAQPTAPPKCSAVPPKNFPAAPPAAQMKLGRVASCVPAKECNETSDKAKAGLGTSFCATNHFDACRLATCDKPTLICMPEFRPKESKGIKLTNCISRPSKIACPKEGEEICLCDLEVEAKGFVQCGSSCQIAPTPTPSAR